MSGTETTTAGSRLTAGHPIDGVELRRLEACRDDRGSFTEVFCEHWGLGIAPTQWSVVRSQPRVLRGMHLHWDHDEYISAVVGRALVGLHDARRDGPTFGAWALFELTGDDPACLSFPRGILHGWYFPEPTVHLQAVSESYVDYHPHDNLGVHWADPDLGIPWPDVSPIVAERAAGFGSLAELLSQQGG